MDKISVMICDDSALMRNLIGRIINDIEGFEVVGKAENGQVLLSMIDDLDAKMELIRETLEGQQPGMTDSVWALGNRLYQHD